MTVPSGRRDDPMFHEGMPSDALCHLLSAITIAFIERAGNPLNDSLTFAQPLFEAGAFGNRNLALGCLLSFSTGMRNY
jgi:hypothetical protein